MALDQTCVSNYVAHFACKIDTLSDKYLTALNTGSRCADTYLFQIQVATVLNEILCSLHLEDIYSYTLSLTRVGNHDTNLITLTANSTTYDIGILLNYDSPTLAADVQEALNATELGEIFTVELDGATLVITTGCLEYAVTKVVVRGAGDTNRNFTVDNTCVLADSCLTEAQVCEIIDKLKYILNNACNCGCS